jgi:hypothetical protein
MLEIPDRRSFAQELGIRHYCAGDVRPRLPDDALDFVTGSDRHRRLCDHNGKAIKCSRDLARSVIDEAQISEAVTTPRWSSNRDEDRVGIRDGARKLAAEFQPGGAHIGTDHVVQPGLVNRHFAAQKGGDLRFILVDANDLVAEIGETGAGNKANVAGADHGNAHVKSIVNMTNRSMPNGD